MFAASLCAGMTRVKGPSSMGTGYENATRSVIKAAPHEKTMRPKIARHVGVDALPLALALLAAIVYGSISVYRHNVFASGAFDLGVQDQTVWGYSQLEMIPNTMEMIRNLLGDHFHPILMTIAPLYWIWNDVRVLLIAQAVLIAAGGVPIFWWARQQLGFLSAIAFEIAYLVFWGVLSAVVYDFHHIAFAVPAVSFGLYAVLTKNNRLLWAMVVLGLLTRENIALTFAAIGVFVMLAQHRWRLGAAVLAFAAIDTLSRIRGLLPGRLRQIAAGAVSIAVLAAGLVLTAGVVRPLDELGTYTWAGQAAEIQSCLDVIPPSASVSASDALLPHLSHRREIYLLTMRTDADYVAIDLASYGGHFFAGEQTQIRDAITRSLAGGYGVACSKGTTVVLRRGGGSQSLSEKVAAFLGGG